MNFRIFNGGVDGLMKLQRMHEECVETCPVVVRFRVGRTLRTSTSSFTTTTMTRRWTRPDGTRTSDAAVRLPHARYNQDSTAIGPPSVVCTQDICERPICLSAAFNPILLHPLSAPLRSRRILPGAYSGGEPPPPKKKKKKKKLGKH